MKKFNIMAVLLLFSISVLAIVPPDNVQATFKKMYPGRKMTDTIVPTL